MDIEGDLITIDAMGTQKAIAETIIDGEADYLLAIKGNHETLHQAVIDHIDEKLDGDMLNVQEHVTTEKGHGRQETRTYLRLPAPEELPGFAMWKGLKSIGIVTSHCLRDGKETIEVRYYVSSLAVSVKRFAMRSAVIGGSKILATGVWISLIGRMSRGSVISRCGRTLLG